MSHAGFSIKSYLIGGLLALLVIKVVVALVILSAGRTIAEDSDAQGQRSTAQATARTVELNFKHSHQLIVAGALRPGLIRFLGSRDVDGMNWVTDVIQQQTPYYRSVYVLDKELSVVAGVRSALPQSLFMDELQACVETQDGFVSANHDVQQE